MELVGDRWSSLLGVAEGKKDNAKIRRSEEIGEAELKREPSRTWFISQWRAPKLMRSGQYALLRSLRGWKCSYLSHLFFFFFLLCIYFLSLFLSTFVLSYLFSFFRCFPRPKSQTVDVMMMTMHQTFANDDTFLFVLCLAAKNKKWRNKNTSQKNQQEQKRTKQNKKKMKINSFLFLFLFSLRVSLDPSMSSSYDSSTGLSRQLVRLQCPDIRWAHTKKMKMKILFI